MVSQLCASVASAPLLLNLYQVNYDYLRCSVPRAAVGDTGSK